MKIGIFTYLNRCMEFFWSQIVGVQMYILIKLYTTSTVKVLKIKFSAIISVICLFLINCEQKAKSILIDKYKTFMVDSVTTD